jgi:hypothetical protein
MEDNIKLYREGIECEDEVDSSGSVAGSCEREKFGSITCDEGSVHSTKHYICP